MQKSCRLLFTKQSSSGTGFCPESKNQEQSLCTKTGVHTQTQILLFFITLSPKWPAAGHHDFFGLHILPKHDAKWVVLLNPCCFFLAICLFSSSHGSLIISPLFNLLPYLLYICFFFVFCCLTNPAAPFLTISGINYYEIIINSGLHHLGSCRRRRRFSWAKCLTSNTPTNMNTCASKCTQPHTQKENGVAAPRAKCVPLRSQSNVL